MPSIIANKSMRYARRPIKKDEPFDASPKDCLLLVAAGLARPAAVVGDTNPPAVASKKPKGKRGRYQNRMLESE